MHNPGNELESLWDNLLSRQPERVVATFHSLTLLEQRTILNHLNRMVNESGWLPSQVESAKAALEILAKNEAYVPDS